jgi:Transposase IS116/IS110/IS902 family
MNYGSKGATKMTAGIDLGDKYSYLFVLDNDGGEVVEEGRLRTTPDDLRRRFDSAERMKIEKSRSVGAYLGLVPGKDQSGESDPSKGVSGEGDEMLRRLVVSSAHYILGPFAPDSDLRRQGQKIASGGGKNANKRAVVAVARKLAVLLHHLWVSREVYEPLHNARLSGTLGGEEVA